MARHLTPRESEVAALIAQGWTDMQIAKTLHISYNTVRDHVRTLHLKVGEDRPGNKRVQLATALGACCVRR